MNIYSVWKWKWEHRHLLSVHLIGTLTSFIVLMSCLLMSLRVWILYSTRIHIDELMWILYSTQIQKRRHSNVTAMLQYEGAVQNKSMLVSEKILLTKTV